jgi:hypothetical protein
MYFVHLSKYLLLNFYADWLYFEALVHLDSAYCNICDRAVFLQNLSCLKILGENDNRTASSIAFLWIFTKFQNAPVSFGVEFVNSVYTLNSCDKPSVVEFCMKFAHSISASHVQSTTMKAINKAIPYAASVQSLSLTNTSKRNGPLDCDLLFMSLKYLKFLTSLHFNGFELLTDDHLRLLCESHRMMTLLNVSGCQELTDQSLSHMSTCLELTSLNLSLLPELCDKAIFCLLEKLVKLKELVVAGELYKHVRLRSSLVSNYFQSNGNKLTALDVSYNWHKSLILTAVGQTCGNLTSLNMSHSMYVPLDNAIIYALCQKCSLLNILNVEGCSGISVTNCELMMSSWTRLVDLRFKKCKPLVQCAFYNFMCQKLKSIACLDLIDCHIIGVSQDVNKLVPAANLKLDSPTTCVEQLLETLSVRLSEKCTQFTHFRVGASVSEATFVALKGVFKAFNNFK